SLQSTSTAILRSELRRIRTLDVSRVGDRNERLLVGDKLFLFEFARGSVDDLGSSRIAVTLAYLFQFAGNDFVDQLLTSENILEPCDEFQNLAVLGDDFFALKTGEPLESHLENRLRLDLREGELDLEAVSRFFRSFRRLNQGDHFVDVFDRFLQPL